MRCSVTIPSAIPVTSADSSASAELKLTAAGMRRIRSNTSHVGLPSSISRQRFMFISSLSVGCKSCPCRLLHAVQNSSSFLARPATCPLQCCTQPVDRLPARSRIVKSVSGSRLAFSKVSHPPVPATQSFVTAGQNDYSCKCYLIQQIRSAKN